MPLFEYKARDKRGSLVAGDLIAPDAGVASQNIVQMGYFPIRIESVDSAGDRRDWQEWAFRFRKVKGQDLVLFTRQMATLFNAGIPLLTILATLEEQITEPKFNRVIGKLRQDIAAGHALSEGMARHPDVFSEWYVSMVRAGESGGVMHHLMKRLADLLERQLENEGKIRAALRYPKLVVFATVMAVSILMVKVVPVFVDMFQKAAIELPWATRLLIALHQGFVEYWIYLLGGLMLVTLAFRKFIETEAGRLRWDRFKLNLPVLGPLVLRASMAKFARVFGTLQGAGVPILEILSVTSRVVQNTVITRVIRDLSHSVEDGLGLAEPLRRSGIVPPLVVQMIGAGEESGTLEEMLLKVSDYYDEEVDRTIKSLTTLLEPILLLALAVVVMFLALAIFTPMWDMTKMATR